MNAGSKALITLTFTFLVVKNCATQPHNTAIEIDSMITPSQSTSNFNLISKDSLITSSPPKVYQKIRFKNPYIAFGLAICPGFVIHGSGLMYADKMMTGGIIFFVNTLATYVAFNNAFVPGSEDYVLPFLIIFFGTWAFDIVASPIICKNYNRKLSRTILSMGPYIRSNRFGNQMGIRCSWQL